MGPQKLKMLGAALCLCGCFLGPALAFAVCGGYEFDKNGVRPKNMQCVVITGVLCNCVCCLGLSMMVGIIKF